MDEQKPSEEKDASPANSYDKRSDIIARTIALAKQAEKKKVHPLAGGLFDAINQFNVQTQENHIPNDNQLEKKENDQSSIAQRVKSAIDVQKEGKSLAEQKSE